MKSRFKCLGLVTLALTVSLAGSRARADAVVRSATGANPNDLASIVAQFMADLGGANNGVGGGPFTTGFRTVHWDSVPNNLASPNLVPGDYYNTLSPRGLVLQSSSGEFRVSAAPGNPSLTPILFGDIDPSYASGFKTYSGDRVLASGSIVFDATFRIPSEPSTAGWVSGLGLVFSSVDTPTSTSMDFLDASGNSLGTYFVPAGPPSGLSFLGVSFTASEQVWSVRINSGNAPLGPGVLDGGVVDLVVMDDFLFGEPQMVPEPSAWGLALAGAGGLLLHRQRRGRRHA